MSDAQRWLIEGDEEIFILRIRPGPQGKRSKMTMERHKARGTVTCTVEGPRIGEILEQVRAPFQEAGAQHVMSYYDAAPELVRNIVAELGAQAMQTYLNHGADFLIAWAIERGYRVEI